MAAVDFNTTEVIHLQLEKAEFHFLMADGDKQHLLIPVFRTVVLVVVDPHMDVVVVRVEAEDTQVEVDLNKVPVHKEVEEDHSSQEHMVKKTPQQFQAAAHFQQNQHQILMETLF